MKMRVEFTILERLIYWIGKPVTYDKGNKAVKIQNLTVKILGRPKVVKDERLKQK